MVFDFKELLARAHMAADKSQSVLKSYFGNLSHYHEKPNEGLVSRADKESEQVIKESLLRENEDIGFLGEEGGLQKNNESLWIVDPLDGTTNFIHGFPLFCTSIGLEVSGEPVLGLIDVPILNKRYWAVKGQGAYCNDKLIQCSQTKNLSESVLVTGYSYSKAEELEIQLSTVSKIAQKLRGLRKTGSAAFDMCMVAEGVFDGFWERSLKPWDTSAGSILVREAGGLVTQLNGSQLLPDRKNILACGKSLHPALVRELSC